MQIFYLSILLLFTIGCSTHIDSRAKQHSTYLDKRYFNKLDFSTVVLQTVKVDDSWYYVRKDGKAIQVITNKDGVADSFKEGFARTRVKGKIGFFNKTLDIVLEPIYDYAFPFYDGVAEICVGCIEHGEEDNRMIEGGVWKSIDRAGLIVEE
jgi:hypothetical protein